MNTSLYKDVSFLSLVSTARFFFRTTIINLLFLTTLYAETQYNISIDNGKLTSDTIFEFDVFIKSEGETFTLTSYQASLSFNQDIIDDGQISFSYIEGTSDFVSSPAIGTGLNSADGKTELTFASLPGNDIITTQIKRIGRFRLQNSNTFANTPSINWDFQGKITTILTGPSFENITNPANHVSELGEISKYHIASVVASDYDTVANTPPEGTIDGLGFYDNVNSARWAAKPMPQWIQYDLGEEKSVSQVNASFFEFDQGRVYDYSIFVSRDGKTWTEMVSHTKSDLQEWTERSFSSISVRYVRLELYSSSGNGNAQQWANIWEAQILGEEESFTTELSSYTGFVDSNDVVLNWITSSEMNNSGFEVERQTNDADFEVIGFVEGNGTTSEANNYSFTDEDLPAGKYSYRLKQMDFEGSYNYSDTLDFEISNILDINELGNVINAYQLYQNYPNPFNPQTTIRFDIKEENFVNLSIYNVLGEKVKELVNDVLPSGSHEVKFDGSELSSGIYIYRLDVKEEYSENKKMSLLK